MRTKPSIFLTLFLALALACGATTARGQGEQALTPEQSKALSEMLALMQQSQSLSAAGKSDEAIAALERALAEGEKAFPEGHFSVALSLEMLALLSAQKGDLARAESLYQRALAIRERIEGPEHPDVAATLTGLGSVYGKREEFAKAEGAYRRALAIREKALGPDSPEVASTLYNLSFVYTNTGRYGEAEPLLKRALAIQEKALGADNLYVALTLNNLAYLYMETGDYERSEALFRRSLAIMEKLFGPENALVATPLNSLATLYRRKGDYLRAEPMLRRALAIQEKAGPERTDTAIALKSLALLYSDEGDDERALPLLERALAILEKSEGPESSTVAATLNSIATIYESRRDYARSVSLYQRALSAVEKTLGTDNPVYATMLSNLAVAYSDQGDYAEARQLTERALAIREKAYGPEHPDVAAALANLASVYFDGDDFERGEPLLKRALAITERAYGPDHPNVGTYLANLATIYWRRGDTRQALDALARNAELRERNLALLLTAGSEERKRRYMATLADETDGIVSFHVNSAPAEPGAAELALTTVLRRKGRVLDAVADEVGALRRRLDPQDRALLDRLSSARSALSRLVLDGGGMDAAERRAEEERLKSEIDRLEAEVSARSAQFRTQSLPVTLRAVQEAIPQDAALVEFVLYRPYDVKATNVKSRFGPPRYVAYVLRRTGAPRWVDLGEAAGIDTAVASWRRALASPASREVNQRARAVDELLMRRVRALVGDARHLLLSPDGALNLIPFAALVNEQNRYLVEDYSITYLTSGRDLLRLQTSAESRQGPVVVADPLFDASAVTATATTSTSAASNAASSSSPANAAPSSATASPSNTPATTAASPPQNRRSADLARVVFPPLPGTRGEAAALGAIMPGARMLTEAQATEAAIKRVSGPSILHIATHGFFLPDQPQAVAAGDTRGLLLSSDAPVRVEGENPLLRSGLALAGANRGQGGDGEDGVLTALEAAGLDLWGTKLVVLSACDTGLGEVRDGDGVYGLRRALVLAGSESQVMSLWQVDDAATRDLMVAYYKRLRAGEGRTEALRQVQLEMIRGARRDGGGQTRALSSDARASADRSHPFFWAAFIQSGEWRAMRQ
jgi:CHAT domain-containing protein/Tfp pilus assembly protein PilF